MPTTTEEEDDSQTKLDGRVEGVPKWTSEGLLDHIMEFIVSNNQAFRLIEKKSFRGILKYQRPSTKESDIPKRTKLQEEIIYKSKVVEMRLKEHFKDIEGEISITFDSWTSGLLMSSSSF
ncbi:hypothetical protein DXG01_010873 [Tephrocybe rancida]|nr:hypothetical protein DXG01_010873 [Tephrocybe rancida]